VSVQDWFEPLPPTWRAQRADAVLDYRKTPARMADFAFSEVFHYSIPAIQETGDGIVQDGSEIDSDKIRLEGGELIVSKLNPRKGCVFLTRAQLMPIVCSTEFVPLVARSGYDSRFAFYVYSSAPVRELISAVVQSVTRSHQRANPEDITKIWLPVPPPPQQRAIADYLDRETARLDALVAAKEQVLGLLAEKRRALITRAVTRGLDPRAPLRDSGIPWLGEIPAHWEARRLRFASPQITVGIVVTPAKYYVASGVPCLRSLNVRETGLTDSDLVYISDESNVLHSKSRVYTGDLVAVRSGQPGATAVVDRRFEGANCIDLIIIRRSSIFESAFLGHFLNSEPAKMQFLSGSGGAIQQHFNIETAADLVVPLPPLDEQRAIVDRLVVQCSQLDAITNATVATISLLKERRAALIAVAVTGQIDVPEASPCRV